MSQHTTIIVSGGAGFIGSQLVRDLLEQSHDHVVTLDRLTYAGNLSSLVGLLNHPRHHFIHGDINDGSLLQSMFATHRPQAVIHLAAESHVDRSIDGPAAFIQTNICGTYQLLESSRNYWSTLDAEARARFRFVHVSTDEVHGTLAATEAPFSESTNYAPRSPYSASKAASDHLVRAWHHTYGLPTMVANCSNNYGPRQHPEKLIPLALMKMLCDEPIPLYGNGQQIRDWLHVSDHSRALRCILENGTVGDTYMIGTGIETRNSELLEMLCGLMDECRPRADGVSHASTIRSVSDRPGHDLRYAIDASHLTNALGWHPQISLRDGLRATMAWYLANKTWWHEILQKNDAVKRRGLL